MKRAKLTIRSYLVTTLWLLTMLAVVYALIGPLRGVYVTVELDVVTRTALTMTLAMTLATAVATLAWRRLPLRGLTVGTSAKDPGRPVRTPAASGQAAASHG